MMRTVIRNPLQRSAPRDESGQDLLEYALLSALISVAAVGVVRSVGTTITDIFWTYIAGVMGAL